MIWHNIADGVYESGFYVIRREIKSYTVWFTSPKAYKLISKANTLPEAKADVDEYARRHA